MIGIGVDYTMRDLCDGAATLDRWGILGSRALMGDSAANGTATSEEFFAASYGGPGYNCKGYVWIGQQQVRALWETGATRNTIDRFFLLELLGKLHVQDIVMLHWVPNLTHRTSHLHHWCAKQLVLLLILQAFQARIAQPLRHSLL